MIANMYGLSVKGFDTHYEEFLDLPTGVFMLSSLNNLIPAPQTLTSGEAWNIFQELSDMHTALQFPYVDPNAFREFIVSPTLMTGNTDTKSYWNFTKWIYLFSPSRANTSINMHAVDKRGDIDSHIESVTFFYSLLRNVDHYDIKHRH